MKGGSQCHKKIIGKFFDEDIPSSDNMCVCCYHCIKFHAEGSCSSCKEFLDTFFPTRSILKLSKSVSSELRCALKELFAAMSVKELKVESQLCLTISSFVNDFIKIVDEIKTEADIVHNWHVSSDVASKVFSTLNDVLYGEDFSDSSGSSAEEAEDVYDEETDSSDDEDDDSYLSLVVLDDY